MCVCVSMCVSVCACGCGCGAAATTHLCRQLLIMGLAEDKVLIILHRVVPVLRAVLDEACAAAAAVRHSREVAPFPAAVPMVAKCAGHESFRPRRPEVAEARGVAVVEGAGLVEEEAVVEHEPDILQVLPSRGVPNGGGCPGGVG